MNEQNKQAKKTPPSELERLVYRVAEMPKHYPAIAMIYFRGIDIEAAIAELSKFKQDSDCLNVRKQLAPDLRKPE